MRIVGGRFRGKALSAPKGRGTRPTSDRAREAIFNLIAHANWGRDIEGARVIDLFAGSGALGLEAMSRGAGFCLFVETEAGARGAIRENIDAMALFGHTRLHRRDAAALGPKPANLGAPFDLVFLDPPYGKGLAAKALERLGSGGWLADDALIVAETEAEDHSAFEGFDELDAREYGAARVRFLSASRADKV